MNRLSWECCDFSALVDFTKMEAPFLYLQFSDVNLWISLATIVFNPLFWNTVARWEYRSGTITKILGSPYRGCILLGLTILGLGVVRDWQFKLAMDSQPTWPLLYENWILYFGYGLIILGSTLVFSSYFALGFYGTFLGDYFGILMEEKVTGFPFSVLDNPMYWGSTCNFLGSALVKASQAGILLSAVVALCYRIAISFEGPFTSYIYSHKEYKRK